MKLTPMVKREIAWLTRLKGETSTACRRTVPWEPIRVESSRGPVLMIASTVMTISHYPTATAQKSKTHQEPG